jgi:hypothetical protein
MMRNIEIAEKKLQEIEEKIEPDNIYGFADGFDFSIFMQRLLIQAGGYVIDTGNWENVNYVCAYRLLDKIKKHPLIWKWFFMVG